MGDLRLRAISAILIAIPAGLAIWFGGVWFKLLVLMIAAGLSWELASVPQGGALREKPERGLSGLADFLLYVSVLGAVSAAALGYWVVSLGIAGAGALFGLVIWAARREIFSPTRILGGLYIAAACIGILWLRSDWLIGRDLVFWLVALVVATDVGAYFAGRAIGGPKLAPRVSPNKTWAGLGGGMVAAGLVGLALAAWQGGPGMVEAALVSAGLAVVAQMGDLLESSVKRRHEIKDASNLIPGHGGVFDRLDGLLAVALVTSAFTFFVL